MICSLIFLATTVNYIDRQILALIKEFLDKELGWTNEQFGLVNSAFQGAYAVGLFAFGWFIDRYGTKIGYAVSIALWSVAAHGARARGVGRTGSSRRAIFLGVSEGGNFPAAIKAVALWFPKRERAFATAIFNSGTNVGAIVAPALVPAIALTLGWRWAFVFAGLAGFVWLLLWFPFYDVPEKSKRVSKARTRRSSTATGTRPRPAGTPIGWGGALAHRQTWSLHRREVHDRSGLVVLPDLAARLLQGDPRPGHQAQLDAPRDDLRHRHRAEHRRRVADGHIPQARVDA